MVLYSGVKDILAYKNEYIWRRIEVVITGRTRNALALSGSRVRISPSPPEVKPHFLRSVALYLIYERVTK